MTRRVLLIDDDDDIREVAQMALEATAGWSVTTAHDGAAGLEAARRSPPDVILLDYMMPGMDGITTLGELKKDAATRDVPVLVLTAKTESGLVSRLKEAGAHGHLAKPFDPMALADQVAGILGWKTQE